jgi:hypothetical protein
LFPCMELRMSDDIRVAAEFLFFLWETNRAAILYVLWLLQTWYMLGMIVR